MGSLHSNGHRAGIILIAFLLWTGPLHAGRGNLEGKEALDFTLPYLLDTSKEFTLSDHYGRGKERKKAIILTFFGTWCKPCINELPALEKLWQRFKNGGLLIVDVCVDILSAEKAKQIIEKAKVNFPVIHDRLGIVKDRYGVVKLPKMFLIDGEGRIRKIFHGFTPAVEKEITNELKKFEVGNP